MVKERMDLLELLRKGGMDGEVDFLREALRVLVEGMMDAEVSSRIGAEYGERCPERVTQRNGYRSRAWDTRVGTMDLHIPKLREGSYFPSLLEPRRRSERALLAVIQQAYVEGVSTRRVDDTREASRRRACSCTARWPSAGRRATGAAGLGPATPKVRPSWRVMVASKRPLRWNSTCDRSEPVPGDIDAASRWMAAAASILRMSSASHSLDTG